MRLYETTFILSPQADDAAFDRQIKAVTDVINRYQGKVIREIRWGIRRMAYPIKRFNQGYYTRMIFEGDRKVLLELERFYKIEEPYIRYLTVVFEGNLDDEENRAFSTEPMTASAPQAIAPSPIAPQPIPNVAAIDNIPAKDDIEKPRSKSKYDDDDI
jgi:small subunit ribosomal protein S6